MPEPSVLPRVAVIMAGGVGERFWPMSRRRRPKQLLPLAEGRSLLELAHARIAPVVSPENVFVATTESLAQVIRTEAPYLQPENVIAEPMGRNTAACLALAASTIERRRGPCVMAVITADHLIGEPDLFAATMRRGLDLAAPGERLVVFGIRPTCPETGFGYIELGPVCDEDPVLPCHTVARFEEKPDLATAQLYVESGHHLWNSGMFAWHTRALRAAFARHAPAYAEGMRAIDALDAAQSASRPALARVFDALPNLSIDYAVMEKAQNAVALPAAFPWRDAGGWEAVRELLPQDEGGNACAGKTAAVETRGSTLHSTGPLIATLGVENLIVVATPDAVIVCPRDRAQDIKRVVSHLASHGLEEFL